jgi:uncharacterized delta-60 repeat protein
MRFFSPSRLTAKRRAAAPRRYARLRLELLEDRRLLSAGAIDSGFGQNGYTVRDARDFGATPVAVAVEGNGQIVMLDQTATGYAVLRFNADGSLDTTFGNQGEITATFGSGTSVVDLAVLANGQIVVGGDHTSGQQTFLDVTRLNSDGSLDTTFGNAGLAEYALGDGTDNRTWFVPSDMGVLGNGDIVAAGTLGIALEVVCLNPDGSLDNGFGSGGTATTPPGQWRAGRRPGHSGRRPDRGHRLRRRATRSRALQHGRQPGYDVRHGRYCDRHAVGDDV